MPQFPSLPASASNAHNLAGPPLPPQLPDGMQRFNPDRVSEVLAHGAGERPAPIELIHASREPDPLPASGLIPWQPQPARYEITWHDLGMDGAPVHPSEQRASQEIFSPVRLHRSLDHSAPLPFPPDVCIELREIAGSPLSPGVSTASAPPCDARRALADDPLIPVQALSPLSSDRPRLHLPTPEFDSTHQVLRVPVPRLYMWQLARSETSLEPCGMPSMAIDGGSGAASRCTADCGEWQADPAFALHAQTQRAAAGSGCLTPARSAHAPNSAPPVLYGSTSAPREQADIDAPAARGDNDAVQVVGSMDVLPG